MTVKTQLADMARNAIWQNKKSNYHTFLADGTIYLVSYHSIVVGYNPTENTLHIFPYHAYSATTSKHVSMFLDRMLGYRISAKIRRYIVERKLDSWHGMKVIIYNEQIIV